MRRPRAPGARSRSGVLAEDAGAGRALFARRVRLVRASSRPRAVLRAIELCAVGDHVDVAEVATALGASSVSELAALNATARRWRAVELSRALQRRSANARLGALDDASRAALARSRLRARFLAEDAFEMAGGSTDERAGLGRLRTGATARWRPRAAAARVARRGG